MRHFYKPADEKRMMGIPPQESYQDWLEAEPEQSMAFMQMYAASNLVAGAVTALGREAKPSST